MSITGGLSIPRLKDGAIVMDLHEFAPVGGRTPGGRDGRRLKRFAEVHEDLPDRPERRRGVTPCPVGSRHEDTVGHSRPGDAHDG